jgi:biopolymer transport protein ExbB
MVFIDSVTRGGVVVWLILLCFFVTLAVIVDRWAVLRRGRFDTTQFLLKLKSLYRHGDVSAVLTYCTQKDSPVSSTIKRGVLKYAQGPARVREAIENAAREEMFHLERRLSLLATMSGLAPLLGLLGGVVGLITGFQAIEASGGTAAAPELAGIVWHALFATACGLSVGIIALVAYNWFTARIRRIVHEMESASNEFIDILHEPTVGEPGANGDNPQLVTRVQSVDVDPFRPKE